MRTRASLLALVHVLLAVGLANAQESYPLNAPTCLGIGWERAEHHWHAYGVERLFKLIRMRPDDDSVLKAL
jgi:hypothetical protein